MPINIYIHMCVCVCMCVCVIVVVVKNVTIKKTFLSRFLQYLERIFCSEWTNDNMTIFDKKTPSPKGLNNVTYLF